MIRSSNLRDKTFSYVDTALRILYINRWSGHSDSDVDKISEAIKEFETSRYAKHEFIFRNLMSIFKSDSEFELLMIHESHHFFQSIFYPFLYYINWLEYYTLMTIGGNIRDLTAERTLISDMRIDPRIEFNFTYTTRKFHYRWDNNKLFPAEPTVETAGNEVFCLVDLIEDVTTIFQFQAINTTPTSVDFFEWSQNPANIGYKRLYKFICKKVDPDFAYEMLPLLVQLAFHTTEPISAFSHALNFILTRFPDYMNIAKGEIFTETLLWLEHHIGTIDLNPEDHVFIQDMPVKVVRHKNITEIVEYGYSNGRSQHYPLSILLKKFIDMQKSDAASLFTLIDFKREKFSFLLNTFPPYATHYFTLDFGGRNSLFVLSKEFNETKTPDGILYTDYFREVMTLKETIQCMLTSYNDEIPHNCHHTACPYFPVMLCKKWRAIPADFNTCGFPHWFKGAFRKEIDIANLSLKNIDSKTADDSWNLHLKLSHRTMNFHYLVNNKNYILTIHKEQLSEVTPDFVRNFLNFLCAEKGRDALSLVASLHFDFYGFDHDDREVFEIPEIVRWVRETKKDLPELFCYVDFSGVPDHCLMLLPIFVKYQRVEGKQDVVEIKYDEMSFSMFISNELNIMKKFSVINKMLNVDVLINNFNHMIKWN